MTWKPATPPPSFGERLLGWQRMDDQRTAFVSETGADPEVLTLRDLIVRSGSVAGALIARGCGPGARVVGALNNGLDFVVLAVAALQARIVFVPAPGFGRTRESERAQRLSGIVDDCSPSLIVVENEQAEAGLLGATATQRRVVEMRDLLGEGTRRTHSAGSWRRAAGAAPAILQYTSGSTRSPKGVTITHSNVTAACAQAAIAYNETPDDVAVSWIPLYHDMGLMTALLRPLYSGYPSVLLAPETFVTEPRTWCDAISRWRGTLSSAPNFAYELTARRTSDDDVQRIDLSSWRVARNAGEVVRHDTQRRFFDKFRAVGFRWSAFAPSYGLAEATLTVTTATQTVPASTIHVEPEALRRGRIELVSAAEGTMLMSSGRPVAGTEVSVLTGPGQDVGVIEVRGPQVSPGYWHTTRGPDACAERAGEAGSCTVLTADVGFVQDGHLYVLGRSDDTIIVRGQNYFQADLVECLGTLPQLRAGRIAAFVDAMDRLVVIAEARLDAHAAAGQVRELERAVRTTIARAIGLRVHEVVVVPARSLPVTTSGKVRVAATAAEFAAGTLRVAAPNDVEEDDD